MFYEENFLVRFILLFYKYKIEIVNEKLLKENLNLVILNFFIYFVKIIFLEGLEYNL